MEFRIADTFTDSLARLTGEEQKAVKTTAFDLQLNPTQPGLQFHKLDKPRDPNFYSVRVSKDIRLIVHRTGNSLLLCYVDHHDKAYQWAERRKLETHPKTGAAQFVEVREAIQQIFTPQYIEVKPEAPPKPRLFAATSDEELLAYGVPAEWLNDVRQANEDSLLSIAEHLPAEAAEALIVIATGGTPIQAVEKAQFVAASLGEVVSGPELVIQTPAPFNHPDAQRRFRLINNIEELERALEYPWEKWTVFLHPAQRELVERDYSGPARVGGSAGTGKTVVALRRAVYLVRRNPDARVLLTTFSEPLANALRTKLRRLIHNEPKLAERIDVWSFDAIADRLFKAHRARPKIVSPGKVRELLTQASGEAGKQKFTLRFIFSEWEEVVDAWQLETWESYRDVRRLGRKTRLPEQQRAVLWSIFDGVRKRLAAAGLVTRAHFFSLLTSMVAETKKPVFDHVIVDEAQDLGIPHLRFFAALGGNRPNGLFFAGDLGQRIFQQPFSWRALGVDIRGRSNTLRVNYRTSHQIRMQADRLLGPEISDVDGILEERKGTVSVFNGPFPVIRISATPEEEIKRVGQWLRGLSEEGLLPHECAIFVRSDAELERARKACEASAVPFSILDSNVDIQSGYVSVSTMHLAKGLEFRAVAVMACDDEIIPLQARIETVGDDAELEEVYNTERHLLYVACTRARDHLLVSGAGTPSEFVDDLYRGGP
jgi:mRNA-degrading endonuclease RelE of RelBE toxin-antitoxin system